MAQTKGEEPLLPLSGVSHGASNGSAQHTYIPNGFAKGADFDTSSPLDSRSVPIAV